MRVDLRLQRIKFLLSLGLMLCHNIVHQHPDLSGHVIDGGSQMLNLIRTADIDRRLQISLLQNSHGFLQFLDGIRDSGRNIGVNNC